MAKFPQRHGVMTAATQGRSAMPKRHDGLRTLRLDSIRLRVTIRTVRDTPTAEALNDNGPENDEPGRPRFQSGFSQHGLRFVTLGSL
jgi:hypothetical protein